MNWTEIVFRMIVQLSMICFATLTTAAQMNKQPVIRRTCQITIRRITQNRREKIRTLTYRKADPFTFCEEIYQYLETMKLYLNNQTYTITATSNITSDLRPNTTQPEIGFWPGKEWADHLGTEEPLASNPFKRRNKLDDFQDLITDLNTNIIFHCGDTYQDSHNVISQYARLTNFVKVVSNPLHFSLFMIASFILGALLMALFCSCWNKR